MAVIVTQNHDGANGRFGDDREKFISQFLRPVLGIEGQSHPTATGNQVGFIGRDPENGAPAMTIFGGLPKGLATKPYKVICFYTEDNEYRDLAARLKSSLERFDIAHEFEGVANRGSWELNCAYKARFIRDRWAASDIPVVWIDADATVETNPVLFEQIGADFAIHKLGGHSADDQGWEFCSGTLYFGKSPLAKLLIERWLLRCEADPTQWDQVHLCSAWCDISSNFPLKTIWLPRAYLQISDAPQYSSPVIKHWQASRASKSDGRALDPTPFFYTQQGQMDRQHNRLWRSAEESFWIAEGVSHIKPETGVEFPEGFDVGAALRSEIGDKFPVLEVGCGVGRIARLFDRREYIGVDISPLAIAQARRVLPAHRFKVIDHGIEFPDAPTVLLYTVLLHIADEILLLYLKEVIRARERVVIAELMDVRWRRLGNPPVFNRNPEEYILILEGLGYRLRSYSKYEYSRYQGSGLPQDSRITCLTFDRREGKTNLQPAATPPMTQRVMVPVVEIGAPQFATAIGSWLPGGGIKGEGRSGFLLFGPYMGCPAGRYRATYRGYASQPDRQIRLDVVAQKGVQILGITEAAVFRDGACACMFEVPPPGAIDMELRAYVDAGSEVVLTSVDIVKLPDATPLDNASAKRSVSQTHVAIVVPNLSWTHFLYATAETIFRCDGLKSIFIHLARDTELNVLEGICPYAISSIHIDDLGSIDFIQEPMAVVTHDFAWLEEAKRLSMTFSNAELWTYADGFRGEFCQPSRHATLVHRAYAFGFSSQTKPISGSVSVVAFETIEQYVEKLSKSVFSKGGSLGELKERDSFAVLYLRYWGRGVYAIPLQEIVDAVLRTLASLLDQDVLLVVKDDPRLPETLQPLLCEALDAAGWRYMRLPDYLVHLGLEPEVAQYQAPFLFEKGVLVGAVAHFVFDSSVGFYVSAVDFEKLKSTRLVFGALFDIPQSSASESSALNAEANMIDYILRCDAGTMTPTKEGGLLIIAHYSRTFAEAIAEKLGRQVPVEFVRLSETCIELRCGPLLGKRLPLPDEHLWRSNC